MLRTMVVPVMSATTSSLYNNIYIYLFVLSYGICITIVNVCDNF
jgi:hypothetical protein